LMKVIPKTCRVHWTRYLRFYCFVCENYILFLILMLCKMNNRLLYKHVLSFMFSLVILNRKLKIFFYYKGFNTCFHDFMGII
jgi:hypothetical protein